MPITFDQLQHEIQLEADMQGAQILMNLWNRVKNMGNEDVVAYASLIDIYANFRIYNHHIKKWMEDAYQFGDSYANKQYRHWMASHKMCIDFFNEIHEEKLLLRSKLSEAGIDYKTLHPHIHRLEIQKVMNRQPHISIRGRIGDYWR